MILIWNLNCSKENRHFSHRARTRGEIRRKEEIKVNAIRLMFLENSLQGEMGELCDWVGKIMPKISHWSQTPQAPEGHPSSQNSPFLHCLTPSIHSWARIYLPEKFNKDQDWNQMPCVSFAFYIFPGSEERINVHQDAWGITREVILLNDFTIYSPSIKTKIICN